MLTDSVNGKKNDGKAKESIQVVDVAQLLLDSVKTPVPAEGEDDGGDDGEPPAGTADSENAPEPEPVK
jgi:hypothetical protein